MKTKSVMTHAQSPAYIETPQILLPVTTHVRKRLASRYLMVSIFLTAPNGELTVSKRLAHSFLTAHASLTAP